MAAASRPERVVVEADGGARGNPGPAGYGAVVLDPVSGEVLAERSASLGTTTNNVAEYSGLIAGLRAAAELGARVVEVRMDSKLVVEQMSGRWKVKNPGLRPLAAEAASLIRGFDSVRMTWVPREQNTRADALANAAMDAAQAVPSASAPESAAPAPGSTASVPQAASGPESAAPEPEPQDEWEAVPPARPRHWVPPAQARTRLILVRHGETQLSAERRFSGRGDPPLTPRGQAQALAVAARIATLLGDESARVVSSPLRRARATAEEIARIVGAGHVEVIDALVECDFGEWEGHTFAEVRDAWPDQLDAWLASSAVAPPGGESIDAVAARIRSAVGKLRTDYTGQTVVVVGHVTGIKLVLQDALDAGPAFLHRMHLDPAGVSIVDSWPDGGVSVRLVNDTSHLGDLAT